MHVIAVKAKLLAIRIICWKAKWSSGCGHWIKIQSKRSWNNRWSDAKANLLDVFALCVNRIANYQYGCRSTRLLAANETTVANRRTIFTAHYKRAYTRHGAHTLSLRAHAQPWYSVCLSMCARHNMHTCHVQSSVQGVASMLLRTPMHFAQHAAKPSRCECC